jgi:small subunit ribosomal protein S8
MPVTDPIADMLTILKNGVVARKESVLVKKSRLNACILDILKKESFILNYKPMEDKKQGMLKIYLKYGKNNVPSLTGLKRISKPGRRVYVKTGDIKSVYGGIGVALISTSRGVVTDKDAKENKLGGELICHVW